MPHFVYIMATSKALKIGVSNNPEYRLKQLQTANFQTLSLIHKEDMCSQRQAYKVEKDLLKRYSKHKAKGEWLQGVSVVRVLKTLKKLKESSNEKYVDKQQNLIYSIRDRVGVEAYNTFLSRVKDLGPHVFVVDLERPNCLIALTPPRYDKKTHKTDLSRTKHIGHLNSQALVIREYENWSSQGRPLIYIDKELL